MASMTNCTQSWPMHLFWRCAIRQVAQSYTSWMQLTKMLGALLCLICLILRILALIHCWIYEHSPTYIFLLTSSRWKLLTEINKYWPGCRQLAWFPRHRVLPTHSWTTVTVKLQTFQPHIHLNCRSTSKLSHSIPWVRSQKDALLLSIALSKMCKNARMVKIPDKVP